MKKRKMVSQCVSTCLSLALLLQLGTTPVYASSTADDEISQIEAAEQSELEQLIDELSQNNNPVSHYTNEFDQKEKAIIWVQGIEPPTIGTDDAELQPFEEKPNGMHYQTYQTKYIPNHKWYDVNKKGGEDTYLCFAVAASNTLHWWLEQNDEYIQKYLQKNTDTQKMNQLKKNYLNSFHNQLDSGIFEYYKKTFGGKKNGYWPNFLQDYFINGYPYKNGDVNVPGQDMPNPHPNNGFFYDVFGTELLTERHEAGSYEKTSKLIKELLMDGNVIMPTFTVGNNSHVVTMWGAEYDLDGNISAVFLSDSDDGDVTQENQAMKRFKVIRAENGSARITTHADGTGGNILWILNTLSLGKQGWEDYFTEKTPINVEWGNNTFDYDGNFHKPEVVSFSGVQAGDDVQVESTGEKKDAGIYSASAVLKGKHASKYSIPLAQKTKSFTINQATADIVVKADLKNYSTEGKILLYADVTGVNGEKPEGKITFLEDDVEIGTTWTDYNGKCKYTWQNPGSGSHQVVAVFAADQYGISKNYAKSHSTPITIDPSRKEQDPLVFDAIDGKRFGESDFTLNATGGNTLHDIQYTSSNPNVITITGNTASIKGAGSTNITATKPGDDTYNSISKTIVVQVGKADAPQITYPTANDLTYGQTLANSNLSEENNQFGSFAWKNPSNVPNAGTTQQLVTFTPNALTEQNYEPITPLEQEVAITVSQATPKVSLYAEVQNNDENPTITLTATVEKVGQGELPSTGTVKFVDCTSGTDVEIQGATTVPVKNGIASYTWTGMQQDQYNIKAEYSGNTNYTAATSTIEAVDTTIPTPATHAITVESAGNGTASASHIAATKGTNVTLTATPDTGYQFKTWKVVEGQVTVSDNAFVMPDMPVSLQAIFEKKDDSSSGGGSSNGGSSGGSGSSGGGSSSGGSRPNSKPQIDHKPDGSTTETVKKPDGTLIETSKKPDGTTSITETRKDGTVITTDKDKEGNATEIIKNPDGSTTTTEDHKDGTHVKTNTDKNGSTTAEVKPGKLGKDTEVTIPTPSTPAPGDVIVIVNQDGTEKVVPNTIPNQKGLTFFTDKEVTIKVENREKHFSDLSAEHWAKDSIAFNTARGLFNGTSENTFSPNQSMSRGMLAMVLYNLESNPKGFTNTGFTDVSADAWYGDAVLWAASQGIVSGYGNGTFGANDEISREQLAVMLYRYAGNPTASMQSLNFADTDQISGYANNALCWAVDQGIISGIGNNKLDPKGTATRAQVATMLMHFIESNTNK